MKCHVCKKGIMKKKKACFKEDNIEYEYLQCSNCGEEILTMKQLKVLANKYRQLRKAKEVTFAKWGNSLAVRIPKEIAEEMHIKAGKQGLMTKDKEGIRIIPTG